MKVTDLETEKEGEDTFSTKKNECWKEPPIFDEPDPAKDPYGVGDMSKGSNLAKLALTLKTFNFADNTTMHGLRYIFMRNISQSRRLLWILVVLGGMGYWYYVVTNTLQSYLSYPTATQISTEFEAKSEFPAVTICNYNLLAKTKLTWNENSIIEHIFAFYPLPSNISLSDYDHVNLTKMFWEKGESYYQNFCIYKERPCNQNLFKHYLTEYGRCLTFDPGSIENFKYQTYKGTKAGLYIAGFFEVDDWTLGPYYYEEGFRVKIHKSGTPPLTMDDGIPVVPSLITEIRVTRHETTLLPPPYGKCGTKQLEHFSSYSRDSCLLECQTEHTMEVCGCKLYYMPGVPGDKTFCTFEQTQKCYQLLFFLPNDTDLFDANKCGCPHDCHFSHYEKAISQSKPSVGYTKLANEIFQLDVREGVGVRIFYQDLQYTKNVEEPIYTTEKLLCDVGGAAGLFLGCSFITIVEFLDFMFEFGWFLLSRNVLRKRKGQSEVEVTL